MVDHSVSRSWDVGSDAVPWGPAVQLNSGATKWLDLCYCVVWGHRPQYLELTIPEHEPGTKVPVVIWIHGGNWVQGTYKRLSEDLHQYDYLNRLVAEGFAVAAIDYRKVMETDWRGMCLDLRAAVRWLRHYADEFDLDADRFAYWGESAGAHLALLTTVLPELQNRPVVGDFVSQPEGVQAIVDWYGPTEFSEFLSQKDTMPGWNKMPLTRLVRGDADLMMEISPAMHVRPELPMPSVFIAHGDLDELVSIGQAHVFKEKMDEAGHHCELLTVEDAAHVFISASHEQINAVINASIDFLKRTIG